MWRRLEIGNPGFEARGLQRWWRALDVYAESPRPGLGSLIIARAIIGVGDIDRVKKNKFGIFVDTILCAAQPK
jgi:hypothetical protein